MKTRYVFALTAMAAALAAATPHARSQDVTRESTTEFPQDGGMLSTMPHGRYQCALPGDASAEAFKVIEDAGFRIGAASSYRADGGRGVYIMKGRLLAFTRGPRKGQQFRRIGTNQLQPVGADGEPTRMICTRLGRTD